MKRIKYVLFIAIAFLSIFIAIPQNVSATSNSVIAGNLVVSTSHEDGLIRDVDYTISDNKFKNLELTTEKPVTISMKEGKTTTKSAITISQAGENSTANVTFDNLNLQASGTRHAISVYNFGDGSFDVLLTFKGENTLKTGHSLNRAIWIEHSSATVQGGSIITNSGFAGKGDFVFQDTSIKFHGSGAEHNYCFHTEKSKLAALSGNISLTDITATTYSSSRYYDIRSDHGEISIKNCNLARGSDIHAAEGISIENSEFDLSTQSQVAIIRSKKGPITISDSTGSFNTSTGFENHLCEGIDAPKNQVTILRSNLKSRSYGSRSGNGINGTKIKISNSVIHLDGYNTGLKAKLDGISIIASNITIDANKKAIVIGPQKSGSISSSKLSLSNSKLGSNASKGRFQNSYGNYLTIKTASGYTASDVKIVLTKPSKPSITLTPLKKTKKIKVSWKKSPVNTKYQVWRATKKTGKYTLVKTTTWGYYSDPNVKPGKTYYYKVCAVSGSKVSSYSNVKSSKL